MIENMGTQSGERGEQLAAARAGVQLQFRYFKHGCLDLALHVSSAEGAQRDAEGLPDGVQVVFHHLRRRGSVERGTNHPQWNQH